LNGLSITDTGSLDSDAVLLTSTSTGYIKLGPNLFDSYTGGTELTFQLGPFTMSSSVRSIEDITVSSVFDELTVDETVFSEAFTTEANDFAAISIIPESEKVSETTSYQFFLTTSSEIPTGSTLTIIFPSSVSISGTTGCSDFSIIKSTANCAQSTTDAGLYQVTIEDGFTSSAITAGAQLEVTLSNIVNPYSLAPSDSFDISISNSAGETIDRTYENAVVVMTEAEVVSAFLFVETSSYRVSEEGVALTFTLTSDVTVAAGNQLRLTYPIDDISFNEDNIACKETLSTEVEMDCELEDGTVVMTIPDLGAGRDYMDFQVYV
jgi:hypothetical protein